MRGTKLNDLVIIGIKGTVLALSASNGAEVWRTHCKGSTFINVCEQDGRIFATTYGEIFCLDGLTGRLLWHNPLRGMGFGLITVSGSSQVPFAQQISDDESASQSTNTMMMNSSS